MKQLRALGLAAVLLSVLLAVARPAIAAEASRAAVAEASPGESAIDEPAPTNAPPSAKPLPDSAAVLRPPALPETARLPKPKTYFLQVMAGSPKRQITLDPPATKLVVTVEAGEAALRCGVDSKGPVKGNGQKPAPKNRRLQAYSCVLGKPLTIERDSDNAIGRFWVQDLSDVSDVRLRLESYSGGPAGAIKDLPLVSPRERPAVR